MSNFRIQLTSFIVIFSVSIGVGVFLLSWLESGQVVLAAPTAVTQTWYVDAASGNDSYDCQFPGSACQTIGGAVTKAANDDQIQIAAGVYAENDIIVTKRLTFVGTGVGSTIVDGSNGGRLFKIFTTATLSGMTIQNGVITGTGDIFTTGGGGILSTSNLTIRDSELISNSAVGLGGAIFNNGTLILENTDILNNHADGNGGGVFNYSLGVISMTNGTIGGNTAGGLFGGGIDTNQPVYLTQVTIQNNSAGTFGGGLNLADTAVLDGVTLTGNQAAAGAAIFAQTGAITMTNSTVSGNIANNNQSGLYVNGPVSLHVVNSTIANNTRNNPVGTGWNGIMIGGGASVTLLNTILAGNEGKNCGGTNGTWTSLGNNLSSDFTCNLTQTGDQQGADPLLGLLADNGGTTLTHALQPGSPAIDAGTNSGCPAIDQRGVARPYDGDNDGTATCDIGAVEARHQLAIADTSVTEGNSGTTPAVFSVTLTPTSTQVVTVNYATLDGTAVAPGDYISQTGTITFTPGITTQLISIQVVGDTIDEADEQFTVQLSGSANADLLDNTAVGTIIDEDGLSQLTISDQTVPEGNSGSIDAIFVVTLSPASVDVITVTYSTTDGTAVASSDYTAVSGTLVFQPGEITKTITVQTLGDIVDEGSSESFSVDLSGQINANLVDGQGIGSITDDDTTRISQDLGPKVLEGNSDFTPAVFTVSLSTPAAFVVTADFAASSGFGPDGAKAGEDFVPISGTLTFQPGVTVLTYTVQIIGDTVMEADELYSTLISNFNVPFSTNGSQGWILNDDNNVFLPVVLK